MSEPGPALGVAAKLVLVKTPSTILQAGSAGDFLVRVTDVAGNGVAGVRVAFTAEAPSSMLFTPETATTNELGEVVTTMLAGTMAGERTATVSADRLPPASLKFTVEPGPPSGYVLNPWRIELYGPGDEATFVAITRDGYGNAVPDVAAGFETSDSTLLSVTPPTTPGGIVKVRALRGGGVGQLTVTGLPETGTIPVTVFEHTRKPCPVTTEPQVVAAGVLATAADSVLCIAESSGAEYALIVYNGSSDGSASSSTVVTAFNVMPELLSTRFPNSSGPLLTRSTSLPRLTNAPKLDRLFHERLLTRSRSMRRLFSSARAARSRPEVRSTGLIRGPSYARSGSAAPVPVVGDLISLNVATEACSSADVRTLRVEAVGTQAVVLADTANPVGGFVRSDYQRFAARFDTLVFPLDVGAFGAPSDIDGNSRVAILFTRAVNELTPANAGALVGGFFHPRDLFPRTSSPTVEACPTSNEGEMFYMLVPDPAGAVNGNKLSRGFVDTLTTGVLAHEFQHLINAGRRMYVNTAAQDFEETWLNEGLSHIAEELLYFRESGYAPRSRLASQSIARTRAQWDTWLADESSNFVRFYLYLLDPANHSPIDAGDALETRGATWSFLRFAVDHSAATDAGVWQRFGNSTTTGLGTLAFGLQNDPQPLLRDFAVANAGGTLADARFSHASWNFVDVFTELFVDENYPVPFGRLQEATATPVSARGGSASYYEFAVPAGTQTMLKFGSPGAPASDDLTFMVLRLRTAR